MEQLGAIGERVYLPNPPPDLSCSAGGRRGGQEPEFGTEGGGAELKVIHKPPVAVN